MKLKTAENFLSRLFHGEPPITPEQVQTEFFDISRLRVAAVLHGMCAEECDEETLLELYFSRAAARLVSPSEIFDEVWYRVNNPDVARAIEAGTLLSGFVHYINYGIEEGRWPNAALQNTAQLSEKHEPADRVDDGYVMANPEARRFLSAFPWVDALRYYNQFGRALGHRPQYQPAGGFGADIHSMIAAEFDPAFYREKYLSSFGQAVKNPFEHYLVEGTLHQHSPNKWFQEDWYRAFYPDVREAVEAGLFPSGFYHYVLHGRQENRLPSFELKAALEARLPGVSGPALIHRLPNLRAQMALPDIEPAICSDDKAVPAVWFILPMLNPDMSFGGYLAAFAMMCEIARAGFGLGIICVEEDNPNREYFIWRQKDPELRSVIANCRLHGRATLGLLELSKQDSFVAYSVWGLKLAAFLANYAGGAKPFLLAQEYEPIFYIHGATRALCAEFYDIDHHPIINSKLLLRFLKANRVGPFAAHSDVVEGIHYTVFEHLVHSAPPQRADAMQTRPQRVLAAYARPEQHAERNLFEMVVLALEACCAEGLFGREWVFIGLGALSDLPDVKLGGGHVLQLKKKMDARDYTGFMNTLDIGICMIDAPHPGVMPFEFAATGALVVTNVYENRSAEDLTAMCGNIVPCEPRLTSMVAAIRAAIARVDDFEGRAARAYHPPTGAWRDVFSAAWINRTFGRAKIPVGEKAEKPPVPTHRRKAPEPQPRHAVAKARKSRVNALTAAE